MGRDTTVLLLDDRTGESTDMQLQSIAHGVLRLEKVQRSYGVTRRHIEIVKLRGSGYREGFHDSWDRPEAESSLAMAYAYAAAKRGDSAIIYTFDETLRTAQDRAEGLAIPVREEIEKGNLSMTQVNPAELSPGEFVWQIRTDVETKDTRVVVIDSRNGFLMSMPGEQDLSLHLHELLAFLNQKGVVTILVYTQHGRKHAD